MKKIEILALTTVVAALAGCTTSKPMVGFNQMPAPAQATVRAEIGNQPIARIEQEDTYGQPAYKIEVEWLGMKPALVVGADGSVIKISRRLVEQREKAKFYEASGAQPVLVPEASSPGATPPAPQQQPAPENQGVNTAPRQTQ